MRFSNFYLGNDITGNWQHNDTSWDLSARNLRSPMMQ